MKVTASKWIRFLNFLLDTVFFSLLIMVVMKAMYPRETISQPEIDTIKVLGLPVYFLYYFSLETLLGKTVAKFLTKTVVVNREGSRPGWRNVAIRTLCRYIPLEVFSGLISESGRPWHDTLSGTRVVSEK
ncbi:MAG: RDD family protein [Ferruginibacter sp.]|nr:RDD family protein [Cytophagales bacterium]